mmetsp:Transcript_385/g.1401  ORF Transcript_385/g.1401 Transcript_385/m.1401 type:complete len:253 (+) Transcript_385:1093-1851(+)
MVYREITRLAHERQVHRRPQLRLCFRKRYDRRLGNDRHLLAATSLGKVQKGLGRLPPRRQRPRRPRRRREVLEREADLLGGGRQKVPRADVRLRERPPRRRQAVGLRRTSRRQVHPPRLPHRSLRHRPRGQLHARPRHLLRRRKQAPRNRRRALRLRSTKGRRPWCTTTAAGQPPSPELTGVPSRRPCPKKRRRRQRQQRRLATTVTTTRGDNPGGPRRGPAGGTRQLRTDLDQDVATSGRLPSRAAARRGV